ncbi:MAG: GAF domain-containing protein [Gemmatimonadetes bacterium]|nr:MAG: GAF domain-containing protein [Gemmatimonadota bacterium]
MISIDGYTIDTLIYKGVNTVIYRGKRQVDDLPVIIKVLKADHPTPAELARLKHEHDIIKDLDLEGVVKPLALEKYKSRLALILEDFNGDSLKHVMDAQRIDLPTFLKIAICLAETLGGLHHHNIIHKDIKPHNIIVNLEKEIVKITDFGISTKLSGIQAANVGRLEGTLAYMSPEQTGRMNRSIDYRSDFYSLGVTFYEMLVGWLPFQTTDPMELIHAHIAKQPPLPHQLNERIPQAVSNVVMKLLAKTAEDRYQSAFGLKADLETCLRQWEKTRTIADFEPGHHDVSDKFQLSQRLYGRENELNALLAAFDRIRQGDAELVLVTGNAGVGKSSLIHEIQKPVIQQRGYYLTSHFDPLSQNTPFGGWVTAFQGLINQILAEADEQVLFWKRALQDKLGKNGQLVIDVIPEVAAIIGEQPPVPELPPAEAQNRFNRVFQEFIRAFADADHPLVIFLDNLEWADTPSLKLMEHLLDHPETAHLLVIGSYRSDEVNSDHPLFKSMAELKTAGIPVHELHLHPFQEADIIRLVKDTFRCEMNPAQDLARVLLQKTNGNPFFIHEFLQTAHQHNLIQFDHRTGQWKWDLAPIQALQITDNVVQLMVDKIHQLPEKTQRILKYAACIGNFFDLKLLGEISAQPPSECLADLKVSITSGLIVPMTDFGFSGTETGDTVEISSPEAYRFKFLHARVQEAASSLIPEEEQRLIHLQIGQVLQKTLSREAREERLFEIINHLNQGRALLSTARERSELAYLNLSAAKKAKASTAYETAVTFLEIATELLPPDPWHQKYALTFEIYREQAQCEYLSTQYEQAESHFELLLSNARTGDEKAQIYRIKCELHTNLSQYQAAIECGLKGLNELGVHISQTPNKAKILLEFGKVKLGLGGRRITDLVNLPEMTNPHHLAIMQMLSNLVTPTYYVNKGLMAVVVLEMIRMSLKYGNARVSPNAYIFYAMIVAGRLGELKTGYEFGRMALELNAKFQNVELDAKLNALFAIFIKHWQDPLHEALDHLLRAQQVGLESGDVIYARLAVYFELFTRTLLGENLNNIQKRWAEHADFIQHSKNEVGITILRIIRSSIMALQGLTESLTSMSNKDFDENQAVQKMIDLGMDVPLQVYYTYKLQQLVIFEEYPQALAVAQASANIEELLLSQAVIVDHCFYYALTLAALYPQAAHAEQQTYWKTLTRQQQKLKRWSDVAPMNVSHMYQLVSAEIAQLQGDDTEAMNLYKQVITTAQEKTLTHIEAIANERAAHFYRRRGFEEIARVYMTEAHYAYRKWGADGKLRHLETRYDNLITKPERQKAEIDDTGTTLTITTSMQTTQGGTAIIDLMAVMRASQAISGEIVRDKLLKTLMKTVLENAGAQKGFLVLQREGQWVIEVEKLADSDTINLTGAMPLELSPQISPAIIQYVIRTKTPVVLHNATRDHRFANDEYLQHHQPKSILCTPILHRNRVTGLLYLENNLTEGAFTSERLEVLNLLSSQIAISIENSNLYASLEAKVRERTQQLLDTERSATLGEMAGMVSHELNNAFGGIIGPLEHILNAPKLAEDVIWECWETDQEGLKLQQYLDEWNHRWNSLQQAAELIKAASQRGLTVVRDLQGLVGEKSRRLGTINLCEVLRETVRIHAPKLERIRVVEAFETEPIEIISTSGLMGQMFTNLLNNSIQALENQPDPTITVRMKKEDSQIEIQFEDNGGGMSPETLQHALEPFFTTKGVHGKGLGLSTVHRLVKEHNGTISIHSTEGAGTTVTLRLPGKGME